MTHYIISSPLGPPTASFCVSTRLDAAVEPMTLQSYTSYTNCHRRSHSYIYHAANNDGTGCTVPVSSHLQQEYQTAIAKRTLNTVLHRMGYRYDYSVIIGQINDVYRRARLKAFMIQYCHALQLEAAGLHIIVYTDES